MKLFRCYACEKGAEREREQSNARNEDNVEIAARQTECSVPIYSVHLHDASNNSTCWFYNTKLKYTSVSSAIG